MGRCHFAIPVFKKRKRESASDRIGSSVLFPGDLRGGSGGLVITVTSFPSATDRLDYGARGDVAGGAFD